MNAILNFLIEASIALAILYLPFLAIGKNNTFHTTNRLILVGSLLFSVVVPFFHFPNLTSTVSIPVITLQEFIVNSGSAPEAARTISLSQFLWSIYLFGCIIFTVNMLITTIKLFAVIRKSQIITNKHFRMVITDQKSSPFSFFNYIFYNPANYKDNDLEIILHHEQEHILHYHYIDNIITGLLKIIFWFHPVVYLYARSLKNIHEYQADMETLQHIDRSHYLNLLYSETLRPQQIGLANHFSYSPLKRRLKMMLLKPTKRYAGVYYFTWIPVVLALVFILGTTAVDAQIITTPEKTVVKAKKDVPPPPPPTKMDGVEQITEEEDVFLVVEKKPLFKGGEEARIKYMSDNIEYPEAARQDSASGVVYISFIIEKNGEVSNPELIRSPHPALGAEAIRVIENMPAWIPGEQRGKAVRVKFTMPIMFSL